MLSPCRPRQDCWSLVHAALSGRNVGAGGLCPHPRSRWTRGPQTRVKAPDSPRPTPQPRPPPCVLVCSGAGAVTPRPQGALSVLPESLSQPCPSPSLGCHTLGLGTAGECSGPTQHTLARPAGSQGGVLPDEEPAPLGEAGKTPAHVKASESWQPTSGLQVCLSWCSELVPRPAHRSSRVPPKASLGEGPP